MSTQRGMIVALVLFVIGLLLFINTEKPPGTSKEGPAPDVTLILEPQEKHIQLASLKGKVVILDFWATWCGPCKASIPELERIYEKYKGKGLEVIGVSVDQETTQSQIPAVTHALGMMYPIMIATKSPDIVNKYGADAIPMMYVIGKNGDLRKTQRGLDPREGLAEIDELIEKLLAE